MYDVILTYLGGATLTLYGYPNYRAAWNDAWELDDCSNGIADFEIVKA